MERATNARFSPTKTQLGFSIFGNKRMSVFTIDLFFSDQLNTAVNNLSLSQAVSMTSLVDEKASSDNFMIDCVFCGQSAIKNELKSDVREVHR